LFLTAVDPYGRKGKRWTTQTQERAFEMKDTPALSNYIRISRPEDKG
jgi:hypothetical protein